MKVLVIGGVAAGMSAAAKIRRMDKNAEIKVFDSGRHFSYGACGIPYFIGGLTDDYKKLIVRTEQEFAEAGIQTFALHEALHVDAKQKKVALINLQSGAELWESYDALMLSSGAHATLPPISGIEKQGVFKIKSLADGLVLRQAAIKEDVKNVVILGAGNFGVEMAHAMRMLHKNVTVIEAADKMLPQYEPEIAALAKEALRENGVALHVGTKAVEILGDEKATGVRTATGDHPADMVVVATGVRPATSFLEGSGVALADKTGAVIINRMMQTNVPGIYAAGDCALVYHRLKQKNVYAPMGTVANKCGRMAGENICGAGKEFPGIIGSAALQVFALELGRTGLTLAEATEECGLDAHEVFIKTHNHPRYYPGAQPIVIKLVYEKPSMRILGAQLAGKAGAALRTDIFAVAIEAGMTTTQLGLSDLIYSPPFSGVWDAVHIACNAAK